MYKFIVEKLRWLFTPKCRVCGEELWMGECPYRFTSKHGGRMKT